MQLRDYQRDGRLCLLDTLFTQRGQGLAWDCGLGKSRTVLYTLKTLFDFREVSKVLLVAPLRVAYGVWQDEAKELGLEFKWQLVHGPKKSIQLRTPAQIYVTNTDGVNWLSKQRAEFDLMVVDESSCFRNWSSLRTKAIRKLAISTPMRVCLSATPAPNDMGEFFAQQFILDTGKTLGTTIGRFRDAYQMRCGFENRDWCMRPEMIEPLQRVLAPWWHRLDEESHLDLPPMVNNEILIDLPPEAKKTYRDMQKEMYSELAQGDELIAFSGGSRYNLCRQIASGQCYLAEKAGIVNVHDEKINALEELIDAVGHKPLLVGYCFTHEMERIKKRWPACQVINGDVSGKESKRRLNMFLDGSCKMLVCQYQSMSHGINGLQHVCNDVCFYSPTDLPETRQQFTKRAHRQGQKDRVRFHHLLVKGTVELSIKRTLDDKHKSQRDVLQAIKEARE